MDIVIRPVEEKDIEEIVALRKVQPIFVDHSLLSNFGDEFLSQLFTRLSKNKSILFYVAVDKKSNRIEGYLIASLDLLKTALSVLPLFFNKRHRGITPNKQGGLKSIISLFQLGLKCLSFKLIFNRAYFIEMCHNPKARIYFSPLILGKAVLKRVCLNQISRINIFYYKNNKVMARFIKKMSAITNLPLEEVQVVSIEEQEISFYQILLDFKYFENSSL